MKISVELSMYPLNEEYKTAIMDFVRSLRGREELRVKTNGMSSHIYGDYDSIMKILTEEIKMVFEGKGKVAMVMKVINDDLDGPIEF